MALFISAGGRRLEEFPPPFSLLQVNRNCVVAGDGGEENAWSSFLVSTAGHRNHDGGLVRQSHGVFCLLPYTTVIYILFFITLLDCKLTEV